MNFKCLVPVRITSDQIAAGLSQRYNYAFLPDGASGHENACNCQLYVSERSLPYALALERASVVHVSHIKYQHEMLEAQGYVPVWVPCL